MIRPSSSASSARSWSREILEQELGRVHAREFARLLCRAALLRLCSRSAPRSVLRALGLEDDPARWRCAARRARALAQLDGYEPAGLLRHALAHAPADWAAPARLIREALAVDASEATRWHAAALDCFEARAGARARLAQFAAQAASESWRARARILLEQGEQMPW